MRVASLLSTAAFSKRGIQDAALFIEAYVAAIVLTRSINEPKADFVEAPFVLIGLWSRNTPFARSIGVTIGKTFNRTKNAAFEARCREFAECRRLLATKAGRRSSDVAPLSKKVRHATPSQKVLWMKRRLSVPSNKNAVQRVECLKGVLWASTAAKAVVRQTRKSDPNERGS